MENQVMLGDCLEVMKDIPDGSVDMILCDLPYGTSKCRWDTIIPFEPLWKEYKRVIKTNGAIVLTASQPFTSVLIGSNFKDYRYNWVWEKSKATGYLNAKKMPMKAHEDVCVFYQKPPLYNPQKWMSTPYYKGSAHRPTEVYGKQREVLVENESGLRYPRTVQYFKTAESEGKTYHPTQKPISLFKYLIKTYTQENEVVLDSCAGVGTTALAALRTNRKYICIENDQEYYDVMQERISREGQP
jgi:site-specific DNA-methyltransferase (adenine-specific)